MTFLKAFNIEDKDRFLSLLFKSEMFDKFMMLDLEVTGVIHLSINGEINDLMREENQYYKDYKYIPWRECKAKANNFIANEPITHMQISFAHFFPTGDIGGIRIKLDSNGVLFMSLYTNANFTMDRGAENEWDDNCEKFLKKHEVASTQI